LFDSPETIGIARENRIDLAETVLFFYEVHELQFDSGEWMRFEPEPSFGTNVSVPEAKVLEGYDVVTFAAQTSPECSPLSCNSLASEVETNSRCLLQSFEQARKLLENGTFNDSEPGPYRTFAVYSVEWPATVRCLSSDGQPVQFSRFTRRGGSPYAAARNPLRWLIRTTIRFQLALVWATISKSLILNG
jgi:hypothetical protein